MNKVNKPAAKAKKAAAPVPAKNIAEMAINTIKEDKEFKELSDEGKAVASHLLGIVSNNLLRSGFPVVADDGSFEMILMKGGLVKVKAPMAEEILRADREMSVFEKGDKDAMRPLYTLIACSTLEVEEKDTATGKVESVSRPLVMDDLRTHITARDYQEMVKMFRAVNLL